MTATGNTLRSKAQAVFTVRTLSFKLLFWLFQTKTGFDVTAVVNMSNFYFPPDDNVSAVSITARFLVQIPGREHLQGNLTKKVLNIKY